jgi:hypothetical protein
VFRQCPNQDEQRDLTSKHVGKMGLKQALRRSVMLNGRHCREPGTVNNGCGRSRFDHRRRQVFFRAALRPGGAGRGRESHHVAHEAAATRPACPPGGSAWGRVRSATAACVIAASLIGCTSVRPPPPPPAPPIVVKPAPVRIARPQPRRQTVHGDWVFSENEQTCGARVSGPRFWLEVTVGSSDITVFLGANQPTGAPVHQGPLLHIRFSGLAGNWDISGHLVRGPAVVSTLPMDDASLGRLIMMLGGGTVDVPTGPSQLPIFALPPAGREGRAWLRCAHQKLV